MPRPYRAPNKRLIFRQANGRFRRATWADFGISDDEIQKYPAVCVACGHGSDEQWTPILKSAPCPKCGCTDKIDRK